ncbi:MAG: T9SS type A sorting domain-containing protein [Chitinophagales bacterium]
MKPRLSVLIAVVVIIIITVLIFFKPVSVSRQSYHEDDEGKEQESRFTELRARYEYDMAKDPATGMIPRSIIDQELDFARAIPEKGADINNSARLTDLNTYYPAGPNNQGGRTRAVAYDVRYNGTTNRVILAGGVSGGIMRSSDGGATWTRVSPDNEIHNVSCITQDTRSSNQNTWYAGGGEPYGNSASELSAIYLGFGLYKSTDNGVTWARLPLNTITDFNGALLGAGVLETFDHPFDYVHKIAINPVNGDLYVAGHRRLMRSTDGGNTFNVVFGSGVAATAEGGQMDVVISNTGKLLLAANGSNPDLTLRGVWTSATGNLNSWTRIAGGSTLGVDSVANWRANSYNFYSGTTTAISKRILMAMAPSNQNIVYVLYENGLSNSAPDNAPEADLFKLDMTSGNSWTNRSANMPDFNGATNNAATDPFAVQTGYDMYITVKPDNVNFVLLGGSSFYRSTDGFATTGNTSWIGGYGNTLPSLTFYTNSHPDIHNAVFNPSNFNEVICANDGGIQMTSDITSAGSSVSWNNISNFQTLQYYNVGMDPGTGRNNFIGGAQDNGTQFRDKMQLLGTAASDSNNHIRVLGGDGGFTGMSPLGPSSQFLYASFQLGNLRRLKLAVTPATDNITPNGLTTDGVSGEFGEFVTNFLLDPDNTENLYYVNYNRLFRTPVASTVTSSTWTELTGVGQLVNPSNPTSGNNIGIRALAISRGPYIATHALFIGTTNGKIFRLDNPLTTAATSFPVDITPPTITVGSNVQWISVNPNDDNEIMAIVSNYAATSVWWTNNAKSATPTWRNGEGNLTLPSFRSCMIVVKKDASNNPVTEYYVGTSVGLYSTVGLGTTLLASGSPAWQREGGSVLNFAIVQSMAYRPVDNVLVLGTHGNGMYYTFLGTPNFIPNQVTGTSNPIVNDKNFIKIVFPTIGSDKVEYRIGNMFTIKRISVQLYNMSGQQMLRKETSYADGNISIAGLTNGAYILSIYSDDGKYRHLQKIIKQ